jgi:hypothetical protein
LHDSIGQKPIAATHAIGQMLQYFNLSCTQGLHQSDALFESHLETPPGHG